MSLLGNNRNKTVNRLRANLRIGKVAHGLGSTIVPSRVPSTQVGLYHYTIEGIPAHRLGSTLYHQRYTSTRGGLYSCTIKDAPTHGLDSSFVPLENYASTWTDH